MAIQQNFPSIAPSLTLNFASSRTLDPRITFTRTSSATCVGPNGLLKVLPANTPRFDHNPTTGESLGLLVEEQRTNLLLRSEEFDNASWTKTRSSITSNAATDPNGSNTADRLVEDLLAVSKLVSQTYSGISGANYIFSCFVKAGERTQCGLRFTGVGVVPGNDIRTVFSLVDGAVVSSSGSIVNFQSIGLGNGWFRLAVGVTISSSGSFNSQIALASEGSIDYQGDGTSGVYLWGAQLEAGSFPTSYIPTTTTAVTRAADVASISGSSFSSWYRADEGSIYVVASSPNASVAGKYVNAYMLSDGTINNKIEALTNNGNGWTGMAIRESNTPQTLFATIAGNNLNAAGSYKSNDAALSQGGSLATDSSVNVPSVSTLYIGGSFSATNTLGGHIKRLTYWGQRLPNSVLQGITQ